uniref:Uncharacterized protein n=1 Tax=Mycena chlorophos TaxID=658473 RepID=A0ABQ0L692_MYCCL|nr:predicted protein [Mycena chlorophos]
MDSQSFPMSINNDDHDSESDSTVAPKKKKKTQDAEDDTPASSPAIKFTGWAMVERPIPVKNGRASRQRKVAINSDDYLKKGPFDFTSHDSFSAFCTHMAAELPCPVANLVMDTARYKLLKPANAPIDPIRNECTYEQMLCQVFKKPAQDPVVYISMEVPRKSLPDTVFWDTGKDEPAKFDYSEVMPEDSGSFAEQKGSFNELVKDQRAELCTLYPPRQYPAMDPTGKKHIYFDISTNRYFELTDTRLGVFINVAPVAPAPIPLDSAPVATAAAAPPAGPSLQDMLIMSLMAQNPMFANVAGFRAPLAQMQVPASSALPSPVKRHKVSVERFVDEYSLDEKDVQRLYAMDFRPGDRIPELLGDDAKEAGFKGLSWARVFDANNQFKADLKAGKFSHGV